MKTEDVDEMVKLATGLAKVRSWMLEAIKYPKRPNSDGKQRMNIPEITLSPEIPGPETQQDT